MIELKFQQRLELPCFCLMASSSFIKACYGRYAAMCSQSGGRHDRQRCIEDDEIAQWLQRLTDNNRSWGFGLCFLYLRNVRGFQWNHKLVYRIYRELELNLRIRPRKRLERAKPEPLTVPASPKALAFKAPTIFNTDEGSPCLHRVAQAPFLGSTERWRETSWLPVMHLCKRLKASKSLGRILGRKGGIQGRQGASLGKVLGGTPSEILCLRGVRATITWFRAPSATKILCQV